MEIDGVNYNLDKRAKEILQSDITNDKESKMAKMFNVFDKNKDGKLDKGEIDSAMGIFGGWNKADKNGQKDDILTLKEIKHGKNEIPELKEFKKKEVKEFVKTLLFANQQTAIAEERAAQNVSQTTSTTGNTNTTNTTNTTETTQETKHQEQEAVKAQDIKDGEAITVQDEIGNTKKINGEIKTEGKDEKSGYPEKITVGKYSYKFEKADEDGKAIYRSMQGAGQTYKTEWQNDRIVLTQREGLEGTTQDGLPDITKNAPKTTEETQTTETTQTTQTTETTQTTDTTGTTETTDTTNTTDTTQTTQTTNTTDTTGTTETTNTTETIQTTNTTDTTDTTKATDNDADKLAEEKGYKKTYRSDFYYDPIEKMHYRFKDGKFVKYPDIKYFNKDGSYRREYISKDGTRREVDYGKDGYPTGMEARNYKDKKYLNMKYSAKVLGLRETFDKTGQNIYYDPKTKMHYQWDEKKHYFKALDKGVRYIAPDGSKQAAAPQIGKDTKGNFAERWNDGDYVYDTKGRVISEPVTSGGRLLQKHTQFNEHGDVTQQTFYHRDNKKLAKYVNVIYDYAKGDTRREEHYFTGNHEKYKGWTRKENGDIEYYIIDRDGKRTVVDRKEFENYNVITVYD